jgi:NitT/TauT family transport system substrate-binding protein
VSRNTFFRAAVAAAGLGSLAIAAPASADNTVIRVGYSTFFNTGFHLYMAEVEPALYTSHGIELVPVDMRANAANCIAAMLAGDVDLCSISTPSGIFASIEGADLRATAVLQGPLAQIYLTGAAASATGVSPDAPVADRIAAMRGISLVTAAPGTLYYNIVAQMMRSVDLSMDDLQYRTLVDQVAMREGLVNGAFDAALWSAGAFADLEVSGDVVGWISVPNGDVPEMAALPTVTVFAPQSWVDANPGIADNLHAAFVDVIAALRAEPERYSAEIKARNFPEMPQVVWDSAFAAGLAGLWETAQVSEAGWTAIVDMQRANNPNANFDTAGFASMVLPAARAN